MLTAKKKFTFIVGVAIACFGVGLAIKSFLIDLPSFELMPYSGSISVDDVVGPPGPEDWGTIRADLEIKVDSPKSVKSDQSFIVNTIVRVERVHFVPIFLTRSGPNFNADSPTNVFGPPQPTANIPHFSNDELKEFVLNRFRAGEIAFSLHLAGAKVEPKGKNPVSPSGKVKWSVMPESSGKLEGFLKPEFSKSIGGHSGEHRIEFKTEEFIPIEIRSNDRIFTLTRLLSAFTGFFGGLLTLPGILAFIKDRRGMRKEKK